MTEAPPARRRQPRPAAASWDRARIHDRIDAAVEQAFALADLRDRAHEPGEVSISSLGRCLRETAYKLSGTPPDDDGVSRSGRAAWLGTWIHRGILPLLRLAIRGSRTEVKVVLRYGGLTMKGRIDLWDRRARTVIDGKTVRDYGLAWARRDGPKPVAKMQAGGYALALEQQGETVDWVAYIYLERGTGAHEVIVEPWDDAYRLLVRSRLMAIDVAAEIPTLTEREERGPGLSIVCDGCAFLRACWGEAAVPGETGVQTQLVDGAESIGSVLELYAKGQAEEGRAKKDKAFARAMLDDTPSGIFGEYELGWTGGGGGGDVPDVEAMAARLSDLGEKIPMKWSGGRARSISVKLAKRQVSRKKRGG